MKADFLPDPDSEYGQDPHLVVTNQVNPKVLWQQNHCGVFRSTDAGRNWTDISQPDGPVNFGFPIAVDPNDEQTAWVVPGISDEIRMAVDGAMCVGRTEDGGKSWTEIHAGVLSLG